MSPEAGIRRSAAGLESVSGADVSPLEAALALPRVSLEPLFGGSEERVAMAVESVAGIEGADVPDLSRFYRVDAPESQMEEIAQRLNEQELVEAAYVKPPAEPPVLLNDMMPSLQDAPPVTPDFSGRQGYLGPAPAGIDARFAWAQPGGRGMGVRIIDIEGAWRFTHEDLRQAQGGVIGGTQSPDAGWRHHGTAVIGEFGGDVNQVGIVGICPEANVRAVSIFGLPGSAAAIRLAADRLSPGDILLLELHRPGPRFNFAARDDQRGYVAVEWWEDDFAAIRYAIARGVIVVEAAGNGAENLDDPLYDKRGPGFPASWTNPFRRANRDSGAIIVGAGAPPPGTHGRDHGPDRSRLGFSNFGERVDAQGWGREVTTTGYGDLQGPPGREDEWYTDQFSGTSSASPIVVGALGCVQGMAIARKKPPLTPAQARDLLRQTGSPQQNATDRPASQRIGNRPNLRQMYARVFPGKPDAGSVEKEQGGGGTGFGLLTRTDPGTFLSGVRGMLPSTPASVFVLDVSASDGDMLRALGPSGASRPFGIPAAAVESVTPLGIHGGSPHLILASIEFKPGFSSLAATFAHLAQTDAAVGAAPLAGDAPAFDAGGDDDPAAPRGDDLSDAADMETARILANVGLSAGFEAAAESFAPGFLPPDAEGFPTIPLSIDGVSSFLRSCMTSSPRVTYGLGAKVPFFKAVPGKDFKKVDCSGFVREAIRRATDPRVPFPDGSVVQHEWVRGNGFRASSVGAAAKNDGAVRIAFLRPQDSPSKIGHVVLVHNARTFESHGGVGPNSRAWTGSGWQAKAFVYLLTAPTG
jgi:hypothetical protein